MKTRTSSRGAAWAVIGLMVAALSAIQVAGQDSPNAPMAPNSTEITTASPTAPVQLSVGAWDVLKLVQSKIGEDVIIAFINNSSRAYNLSAAEIIYLREQGASEAVITAMLTQRSKAPVTPAPAASEWAAPASPAAPAAPTAPAVATAPAYVQPATVYVAPPAPSYNYYYPSYGYYPGYGGYYPSYGYYSPLSLSLGFGFGFGGYHGGGYHGGYHGGHH